jgi:hypothetical protein
VELTFGNFRQRRVGHGKPAHEPQGKGLECDATRLSRGIELTGINDKLPDPPLALGVVLGHENQRLNKLLRWVLKLLDQSCFCSISGPDCS